MLEVARETVRDWLQPLAEPPTVVRRRSKAQTKLNDDDQAEILEREDRGALAWFGALLWEDFIAPLFARR